MTSFEDHAPKMVTTSAGPVACRDVGSGPPVVFLHHLTGSGTVWSKVVDLLQPRVRCIVPDLPLGAHRHPMNADADLTPIGLVKLLAEVLDGLGLESVAVVGNDTGGALAQIFATEYPERVDALVITNCDAFEHFPPRIFGVLKLLPYLPGGLLLLGHGMRIRLLWKLPLTFRLLAKRPLPPAMIDAWFAPLRTSRGVRRDAAKVIRGISPRYTMAAADKLRHFTKPVLVAWAPEDRAFRVADARRLCDTIPNAHLALIEDSYTFVAQDQPERTAALIGDFLAG
jgi:pimeloyl-ACP methyl ester carboxylesterase